MKKIRAILVVCFCLFAFLLPGCVKVLPDEADLTNGVDSNRFNGRTLNTLMDMGGMGNYYEPIIMKLQQDYPGLTINADYETGSNEIFRIKALSNSIPDIFNLNEGRFNYYHAMDEGYCLPLDEIFQTDVGDGKQLQDLLEPNMLEYGAYKGKHYLMCETVSLAGLWYDKSLFEANHLTIPETWDDFLTVCEQLKTLGINGIGYCGDDMANEYAVCYWFLPLLNSVSPSSFLALEAGDANAWTSSGMQETISKLSQLRDRGYIDLSTLNLKNAETQVMFINHDFAFLPCGSWLENEMADAWPEDFQLAFLPFSGRNTANGTNYICKMPLVSGVSSATENLDIITEFYKIMFTDSQVIQKQVAIHKNAMPLKGFYETYGDLLNPSVQQSWQTVLDGVTPFVTRAYTLYPEFAVMTGNSINELMDGEITNDEFSQRLYALFQTLKKR